MSDQPKRKIVHTFTLRGSLGVEGHMEIKLPEGEPVEEEVASMINTFRDSFTNGTTMTIESGEYIQNPPGQRYKYPSVAVTAYTITEERALDDA